jgi:hypothetical protein
MKEFDGGDDLLPEDGSAADFGSRDCHCDDSEPGKGVAGPEGRRWLLDRCSVRRPDVPGGCHLGKGTAFSLELDAVFEAAVFDWCV